MAGSSSSSEEDTSSTTLAASLLRVRGSFRFRHHGLKQKPHLILRRVEDSDDGSDDGEVNHVVRFSLFATKRIDVRPGKELLLCIATDDEAYKDVPLVLEAEDAPADVAGEPGSASGGQVQESNMFKPVEQTVPPKMRRTWTKKAEVNSTSSAPAPARVFVSAGIQATPETESKGVEAMPEQQTMSVQITPEAVPISMRAADVTGSSSAQVSTVAISTLVQAAVPPSPTIANREQDISSDAPVLSSSSSTSSHQSSSVPGTPTTSDSGLPSLPQPPARSASKRTLRSKGRKNVARSRKRAETKEVQEVSGESSQTQTESAEDEAHSIALNVKGTELPKGVDTVITQFQKGGVSVSPLAFGSQSTLVDDGDDGEAEMEMSDDDQTKLSPMDLDSPLSSLPPSPVTPHQSTPLCDEGEGDGVPAVTASLKSPLPTQLEERLVLSPLLPGASLDTSSLSAQEPLSGKASAASSRSRTPESPGYTPSALVLPELTDESADIPTAAKQSQSSTAPAEPKACQKDTPQAKSPSPTTPRGEQEVKRDETDAPPKPSKKPGPHDMFVRATMTSSDVRGTPSNVATASSRLSKSSEPTAKSPAIPPEAKSTSDAKQSASFSPTLVPVDPRQIARPASGPSNNPLNIAPSRMPASMRSAFSGPPPPLGPRSLQSTASRKPVVIGTGWSAGKGILAQATTALLAGKSKSVVKLTVKEESQITGLPSSSNAKSANVQQNLPTTPPPPPSESPPPPPTDDRPKSSAPTTAPPKPPASKWGTASAPKFVAAGTKVSETSQSHSTPLSSRIGPHTPSDPLEVSTKVPSSSSTGSAPPPSDPSNSSSSSGSSSYATARTTASSPPDPKAEPPVAKKDKPPHMQKWGPALKPLNGFTSGGLLKSTLDDIAAQPPTSSSTPSSLRLLDRISPSPSTSSFPSQEYKAPPQPASPPPPAPLPTTSTLPHHPSLPPKPNASASKDSSHRGVKRERPPTPAFTVRDCWGDLSQEDLDTPLERDEKPKVACPTIRSLATRLLRGGEPYAETISFSSDGSYFVLGCSDNTVRVWSTREKIELARLLHHSCIKSVLWLEGDSGVIVMTSDGLVSKWTKTGENGWKWAKILHAGTENGSEGSVCFAYMQGRIAVSFPHMGVKIWILSKGIWQAQRSILRQNVTAIKFIEGGQALLGGTRDGTLWSCEIPNGTLRACGFLKNKIISLDVEPQGTHVLVTFSSGDAALVALGKSESKGNVEMMYSVKKESNRWSGHVEYGAAFATQGQAVVCGTVDGCALVWDRKKGKIVYGLEHHCNDVIRALAVVDSIAGQEGCIVTSTWDCYLCWWALPVAAGKSEASQTKRQKVDS